MPTITEFISHTEGRMAVLRHAFHNTETEDAFMQWGFEYTSFNTDELHLAWELLDYLENAQP